MFYIGGGCFLQLILRGMLTLVSLALSELSANSELGQPVVENLFIIYLSKHLSPRVIE